jgi:hypothetical protein
VTDLLSLQELLLGRWSLERELGRGGMGSVWLARDLRLDRPVAIKVLHPALACERQHRERFLHEARTAAKLAHPHIVPIYGVEARDELAAIVMGLIDGETLGERIRRRGALPAAEAERILRELSWALSYAHQSGIVHRDLTLANVLLERDSGRAVLVDFGLAAEVAGEHGAPMFGTPGYLAPEVIRGETATPASDLYALGVIAYTMLAGRPPFTGNTTGELLARHLVQPPPDLGHVATSASRRLTDTVMRCLAKEPGDRPESAMAVLAGLERVPEPVAVAPALTEWFTRWDRIRNIYAIATPILGMQTWLLVYGYFETGIAELAIAAAFGSILSITALPIVAHAIAEVMALRRLHGQGFGVADIRAAWSHWTATLVRERQQEGLPPLPGRVVFDLTVVGAVGLVVLFAVIFPLLPILAPLDTNMTRGVLAAWASNVYLWVLTGVGIGFVAPGIRLSPTGWFRRLTHRLWNSRLAGAITRLAVIGQQHRLAASNTLHRNTEMVLGLAMEELWGALPHSMRTDLPEVPSLWRTLQAAAEELRELGERLQESEQQIGADDPAEVMRLAGVRTAVMARQREAITALERLRLQLLRAVAERRATADLTHHLEVAHALERSLLADLAGHAELRRFLAQVSRPERTAANTPSPTPTPTRAAA